MPIGPFVSHIHLILFMLTLAELNICFSGMLPCGVNAIDSILLCCGCFVVCVCMRLFDVTHNYIVWQLALYNGQQ